MGTYYLGAIPIKTPVVVTASDAENYRIYRIYNDLYTVLRRNGYPAVVIPWVIAQVLHETNYLQKTQGGGFNLTGIKYYPKNKNHVKYGQVRGYVKFPSLDAWAADLRDNYLKQNKVGAGRPIDTTTDYNEYARRLKANGYYEAPMIEYTTGLQRALLRLAAATSWAKVPGKVKAVETTNNVTTWPQKGELAEMKKEVDQRAAEKEKFDLKFWVKENPIPSVFLGLAGLMLVKNLTR